jgi:UDP-N-acetylmuramate--alanine ligase
MQRTNISGDKIRQLIRTPGTVLHFVGIGGVSMASLARLALLRGIKVTGSDRIISKNAHKLIELGASVHAGHDGTHVPGATAVVYSHAISPNNPELHCARSLGIPLISRAQFLGAVMLDYKNRIGVSGTHGKSTTTSMLDEIFTRAGVMPTVLSGAELTTGEPLRVGEDNYLIYEACEYRDSFLEFSPTVAIGLNLELDHVDYFDGIKELKRSFAKALGGASGFAVVNGDDEYLSEIIPEIKCRTVTYGEGERTNYRYLVNSFTGEGYEFSLYRFGAPIGSFTLNMKAQYNVTNAVAAIVTALELGIDVDTVKAAVSEFHAVPRRLELVGHSSGRAVYYDYAHHPTEIAANINALRLMTGERITVVFKPHTFTRTQAFWEGFRASLSLADHVVLTDIYPAREEPIPGVNSRRLAQEIGGRATFLPDYEVASYVLAHTDGVIVVMGAGDMEIIKNDILKER